MRRIYIIDRSVANGPPLPPSSATRSSMTDATTNSIADQRLSTVRVNQDFAGLGGDENDQFIRHEMQSRILPAHRQEMDLCRQSVRSGQYSRPGRGCARSTSASSSAASNIRGFANAGIGPRDTSDQRMRWAATPIAASSATKSASRLARRRISGVTGAHLRRCGQPEWSALTRPKAQAFPRTATAPRVSAGLRRRPGPRRSGPIRHRFRTAASSNNPMTIRKWRASASARISKTAGKPSVYYSNLSRITTRHRPGK